MDRRDFGELVATLREELGWTQAELAQAASLEESAVSIIERGARKHFDAELIYRLANTLQLTTLERREFLLAASGVDESHARFRTGTSGNSAWDAERTVQHLTQRVEHLRFPAYLIDCYGEIVAANAAAMDLFQVPIERARELADTPAGLTLLHFLYGEGMALRAAVIQNWEGLAVAGIRTFREATLRYRGQPYFKYLLKRLRNPRFYPTFERYWRKSTILDQDRFSTLNVLSYVDNIHGPLNYCVSTLTLTTPSGELSLAHCIPLDEQTSTAFRAIVDRMGVRAFRFASWPEKRMH